MEVKGIYLSELSSLGGRTTYSLMKLHRTFLYCGLEYDRLFAGPGVSSGGGHVFYPHLGGEYFINERFSVSFDFGPAYADYNGSIGGTGYSGKGWIFFTNFGLWYYF